MSAAECSGRTPPLRDYDAMQPLAEGRTRAPEYRYTLTLTPMSEADMDVLVADIRARFGQRPLVHVLDRRDRSSHVESVRPTPEQS